MLHLIQAEVSRLTSFVEGILVAALEPAAMFCIRGRWMSRRLWTGPYRPGGHGLSVGANQRGCRRFPPVLADEAVVQDALVALVDNALKYAPDSPVNVPRILWTTSFDWKSGIWAPASPENGVCSSQKFERLNAVTRRRSTGTDWNSVRDDFSVRWAAIYVLKSPPEGGIRSLFALTWRHQQEVPES